MPSKPGPFDVCQCGHTRTSHFSYRASHHAISGCEVVVRGDGTGCPCRGFRLDDGSERHEDDGLHGYGHPGDYLRGLE